MKKMVTDNNNKVSYLKRWMLCSDDDCKHIEYDGKQNDDHNVDDVAKEKNDHDILILDGGVSTFLEQLQKDKNDSNNNAFKCRSLWSSSLLLNEQGQKDIKFAHETFYNSGCDIISTVTYQLSYYNCCYCDKKGINMNRNQIQNHEQQISNHSLVVEKRGDEFVFNFTEEDIDELLKLGIQLANEVRFERRVALKQTCRGQDTSSTIASLLPKSHDCYVVVSLGCFGACLADGSEYTGNYSTLQELITFHERRFQTIMRLQNYTDDDTCMNTSARFHIDGIAFETIPSSLEVKAIIHVLKKWKMQTMKESNTVQVAIWLSLACKDGATLNDGTLVSTVLDDVESLDDEGLIHGIGVNCFDVQYVQSLTTIIARHQLNSKHNRAVVFYPNSGETWDAVSESWVAGSGCSDPDLFAIQIMRSIESIQTMFRQKNKSSRIIVGGCCRTTPSTIQALRSLIDEKTRSTF